MKIPLIDQSIVCIWRSWFFFMHIPVQVFPPEELQISYIPCIYFSSVFIFCTASGRFRLFYKPTDPEMNWDKAHTLRKKCNRQRVLQTWTSGREVKGWCEARWVYCCAAGAKATAAQKQKNKKTALREGENTFSLCLGQQQFYMSQTHFARFGASQKLWLLFCMCSCRCTGAARIVTLLGLAKKKSTCKYSE